jgi:hypothetical protein
MRLDGRKVYQAVGTAQPMLEERSAWHIAGGDDDALIFAEHRCETPEIFEPAPLREKPKVKEMDF